MTDPYAGPNGRFATGIADARGDGSAPVPPPEVAGGLGRAWRGTVAVVRGLSGLDKYDRYLRHHRRTHPDETPMGAAEFWRCSWESEGNNPRARCC